MSALLLGAGAASGALALSDPEHDILCGEQFTADRQACLAQWGPEGVTPNPASLSECRRGAYLRLLNCYAGDPENDAQREAYWQDFLRKLRACFDEHENDPAALQECLEVALIQLEVLLCLLEAERPFIDCGPDDNLCVSALDATRLMSVDGEAPRVFMSGPAEALGVKKDSLVRTTAGEPAPGGGATIDDACLLLAAQLVVYRDKNGVQVRWTDEDITPGDGFELSVDLGSFDLGQAGTVGLIEFWIGEHGLIAKSRAELLAIESPGGAADWNRDGVLAPDDVVGFMESIELGVPRADLTTDGAHDGADMVEYVDEYSAGGS